MEIREIDPKQIEIRKPDKEKRTFVKAHAEALAKDINALGLLHPPAVRAHPTKPGHYVIVAGMHRVYACSKILNWQAIPCQILECDDDTAEWASISENLWRNPLKKAQYLLAVQQWHTRYVAWKKAQQKAADPEPAPSDPPTEADPIRSDAAPLPDEPASTEPEPVAPTPPGFNKLLSDVTGASPRKSKMDVRIAKNLKPEQLTALGPLLEKKKIAYLDVYAIACLKLPEERAKAVTLICSGMDAQEALKQAVAQVAKEKGVEPPPDEHSDEKLTDDEWLTTHCESMIANLRGRQRSLARFKENALFYRTMTDILVQFRKSTKKLRQNAGRKLGPMFSRVNTMCLLRHPKHWIVCGVCGGTGTNNNTEKDCDGCFGHGFKVTFDPNPYV